MQASDGPATEADAIERCNTLSGVHYVTTADITSLLSIMDAFVDAFDVQFAACVALCAMSEGQSRAAKALRANAQARLYNVMDYHYQSPDLMAYCCHALSLLASKTMFGKYAIVASGGVERVMACVEAYPGDETMMYYANQALAALQSA